MQQTFVKTIHSYQVEFDRLLFPVRYKVYIRIENKNPVVVEINKDESSCWFVSNNGGSSFLVDELEGELIGVIKENESKAVLESV
jgi:hypothetical protein